VKPICEVCDELRAFVNYRSLWLCHYCFDRAQLRDWEQGIAEDARS